MTVRKPAVHTPDTRLREALELAARQTRKLGAFATRVDVAERQVRSLSAELRAARIRIAELESK